jgi:electron transport complex protein RnfD
MADEAKTTDQTTPAGPAETPALHVAPGPHLQNPSHTTRRMMVDVLIGLAPITVAAVIVYRQYAIWQMAVCVASCCLAEAIFSFMRHRKPTLGDCSAVVTGLILAFSLPWNSPLYVGVIGSFVAIGIGKALFGGVGMNLFNPAMVGRAFVMLAFGAVAAPAYVKGLEAMPWLQSIGAMPQQYAAAADAVSSATPMTAYKLFESGEGGFITRLMPLLLGNTIGCLGETSAIACIVGGAYLLIRRTASWQIPAGALLAVVAIAGAMNIAQPGMPFGLMHQLFGGALLFGAFFIATDPVTSPLTPKGKFIFGLGVGGFVMCIRVLSNYPEGVMFAVLLMNALVPLINRWTVPKPLGGLPPTKAEKK